MVRKKRLEILPAALVLLLMAGAGAHAASQPGERPPQFVQPTAEALPDPTPEELAARPVDTTSIEVERRREIADHPHTIAIVHAFVVETKAVLFQLPEDDPELGPRFDMYTRVKADVLRSFKSRMPERIEFWVHGGVIEDAGERIFGLPYAIFTTEDIRLEPGDEVLACIQSHLTLPNGDLVLMLRGFRRGASFPNSQIGQDQRIGLALHDYLLEHYSDVR
jgi:hypothetical protein